VKHILSTLDTAKCYIESLYDGIDFSTNVTRARFENELSKVLPSLIDPIHKTLANSGIKASDIDKVIPFGSFTRFYFLIFFANSRIESTYS
jgi:molecular chaperone DnaK (HSP70)